MQEVKKREGADQEAGKHLKKAIKARRQSDRLLTLSVSLQILTVSR